MVLALSSTGEGNPEKMVYYQGDIKLSDLANCVYKKITHYYDLGGSSGDTVAKTWADYFDTLDIGDDGKVYDPDKTPTTQTDTMEISDKGAADPDTGLKYIEYSETTEDRIADPTKPLSPAYDTSQLTVYFQRYGNTPTINSDGKINQGYEWGYSGSGTTGYHFVTSGGYFDCGDKPYFMQLLESDSNANDLSIMIVDKSYGISYSIMCTRSDMMDRIGKIDPFEYMQWIAAYVKNPANWPTGMDDWIIYGDRYIEFITAPYDNPSILKTTLTSSSNSPYVYGLYGYETSTKHQTLICPLKDYIGLTGTPYIGYIEAESPYWDTVRTLEDYDGREVYFGWDPVYLYNEFGIQLMIAAEGHRSQSDAGVFSAVFTSSHSRSYEIGTSMLKRGWGPCELGWTGDIADCVAMLKAHDGDNAYTYKINGETISERYYYMQNGEDAYIHKAT